MLALFVEHRADVVPARGERAFLLHELRDLDLELAQGAELHVLLLLERARRLGHRLRPGAEFGLFPAELGNLAGEGRLVHGKGRKLVVDFVDLAADDVGLGLDFLQARGKGIAPDVDCGEFAFDFLQTDLEPRHLALRLLCAHLCAGERGLVVRDCRAYRLESVPELEGLGLRNERTDAGRAVAGVRQRAGAINLAVGSYETCAVGLRTQKRVRVGVLAGEVIVLQEPFYRGLVLRRDADKRGKHALCIL